VTPVAAAVGVSLVDVEHRGRALSVVFGGLTFAQALGVPAGAWLGYEFGWRSVFVIVAVLAVAALVAVGRVLPKGVAETPVSLRTLADVLAAPRLVVAIAFTAFFIGGIYVVYTFLAPLLETRYGLSRDGVSAMLLFFGMGAILGNAMGGWLTDRIGAGRTLAALCCCQMILMPTLTYLTPPLAAAALLLTLWSVCGWSFMVAQQARLATLAPRQIPVVFALNAAAIYAGAAVGSAIGGLALKASGLDILGSVGAMVIALALASIVIVSRMTSRAVASR